MIILTILIILFIRIVLIILFILILLTILLNIMMMGVLYPPKCKVYSLSYEAIMARPNAKLRAEGQQ